MTAEAFYDEYGQLRLDPEVVQRLLDKVEFNDPQDAFHLASRDCMAFSSHLWHLPEGIWEPWDLSGRMVNFDGHRVKCWGSEAFCIPRSPEHPYRFPISLAIGMEDLERVGYDYSRFDRT